MARDASVFFSPSDDDDDDDDAQPDIDPAAARELMEVFGERFAAVKAHLAEQTRTVNQLKQALGRLRAGDEARARKVITKVLAHPWDEEEQTWPGWRAAMMLLHDTVIDDLEAAADGDDRWLRACEQVLTSSHDPLAQAAIAQVLAIAAKDYRLEAVEAERCLAVTGGEPPRSDEDLAPATPEDLPDAVVTLLRVVIAYRDAKNALRTAG